MSYERIGGAALDYRLCEYDGSRLAFRGPKRSLDEPFVAALGGTETFGKFVPRPYVDRLEDKLEMPCLNLGVMSAGLDAFASDLGVLSMAARAEAVIVQAMGVHNLSNRFYTVHPLYGASAPQRPLFAGLRPDEKVVSGCGFYRVSLYQPSVAPFGALSAGRVYSVDAGIAAGLGGADAAFGGSGREADGSVVVCGSWP